MNDHDLDPAFEDLARRAAGAVRASVVHLDPPAIAGPPWYRRPAPAIAAVAAAVFLIVGIVALLARDTPQQNVASAGDVAVLSLPDDTDLELSAAQDLPMGPMIGAGSTSVVYTADGGDPLAGGDLFVVVADSGDDPAPEPAGDTVTVRGRQAEVLSLDDNAPFAVGLQWMEEPGLYVYLGSRTLAIEDLVAAAEDLRIEDRTVAIDEAPEGYQVALRPTLLLPFASLIGSNEDGWIQLWEDAEHPEAGVYLVGIAGTADDLAFARYIGETADDVTVRGKAGVLVTLPGEDSVNWLVWQEGNGVISMTSTRDDLVELAESLQLADDEAWDALQDQAESYQREAELEELDDNGGEVLAEGTLARDEGSVRWRLYLETPQMLCLSIEVDGAGGGGSSSCSGATEPVAGTVPEVDVIDVGTGYDSDSGVLSVTGQADAEVAEVVLDGDVVPAHTGMFTSADGTRFYAVIVDGYAGESFTVVAKDADGNELLRSAPFDGAMIGAATFEGTSRREVGSGEVADITWGLSVDAASGDLCVSVQRTNEGSEACGVGDLTTVSPVTIDGVASTGVATRLPGCATTVRVETPADLEPIELTTIADADGSAAAATYAVVLLPGASFAGTLAALDDAGATVATLTLGPDVVAEWANVTCG